MQRFCNLLERVVKYNPRLAEAKADAFMKALADKFEDQVAHSKTLKNRVDRDEIEYAIEFFKKFKDSLPPEDRDLSKDWTIGELLQFLQAKPGYKPPSKEEEVPDAPPIAFPKEGDQPPGSGETGHGITVYDGSKEDRCVTIGKGQRWCITQGSFANYRYSKEKKYPTFYLVKDATLPSSDPKSFFVIMVGNDGTYKASDKTNNDLGGRRGQSEWDKWGNWDFVVQHFPSVKGLEHVFKYVPIKQSELVSKGMNTVEDWLHLTNVDKKNQLLINLLRQDNNGPFRNQNGDYVDWKTFIKRYLARPDQKAIADLFVKSTYENPKIFLQNYDYFTPAQQKSIIANTNNPQHPIGIDADDLVDYLRNHSIPFEAALELLKAGKMKPTAETHLYVTGRDNIVELDIKRDGIKVYVTTRGGGRDEKILSQKTEHYLLDDPNLDSINLAALAKAVEDNNLSNRAVQAALSKESEGKELVKVGDDSYIVQYGDKGLSIINTQGKSIKTIPNEVADKVAASIKSNVEKRTTFLKSIADTSSDRMIPNFTAEQFQKIVGPLSDEERIIPKNDEYKYYIDIRPNGFMVYTAILDPNSATFDVNGTAYSSGGGLEGRYGKSIPNNQQAASLEHFFQNVMPPLSSAGLMRLVNNKAYYFSRNNNLLNNVRLAPDNEYVVKPMSDGIYFISKTSKDNCKKLNYSSGNIVNLRLSQANYDRALGREAQPRQAATRTPAAGEALPATSQGGSINLQQVFADNQLSWAALPTGLQRKLAQGGTAKNIRADRGTDTRNELLRGRGRVTAAYQLAGNASALYIARLNSDRVIGIIASQPGNVHGFITGARFYQYASASDLPNRLQANNLNEDMINKLDLIKKLAEQVIKENQPAPSKPTPGVQPGIAEPGTDEPEEPSPWDPDKDQEVDTKPKASGKGSGIEKKIIDRAKSI